MACSIWHLLSIGVDLPERSNSVTTKEEDGVARVCTDCQEETSWNDCHDILSWSWTKFTYRDYEMRAVLTDFRLWLGLWLLYLKSATGCRPYPKYRKCAIVCLFQQTTNLPMRRILPGQRQFICIHDKFRLESRVFVDSHRYGYVSSNTSYRYHSHIKLMILRVYRAW